MSVDKKTYTLGKIKKLVDLNGDTVNFDINFRVKSKNNQPFEMLVVDQTTLDSNPNIEYKKVVNGEISGNLVHDKNIYQNYFLILKSENPCECEVEIQKKELPKTPPPPVPTVMENYQNNDNSKKSWFKMKTILLIVLVIGILGYGYYWYSNRNKSESVNKPEAKFKFYSPPQSSASPHASPHASPQASPQPKSHFSVVKSSKGSELLERLKRLHLN
jgi:hypothetical protein